MSCYSDFPRNAVHRGILNLLLVAIIAVPILVYYLAGVPTNRGFYCNDESISYPYHSSTIPSWLLYVSGFAVPIGAIVVVEMCCRVQHAYVGPVHLAANIKIPAKVTSVYALTVGYLFGTASCQTLTDLAKYTIGRLRPHFFDVCRPTYDSDLCGTELHPLYVTNYTCLGNPSLFQGNAMEHRIKEAHISFVSGHASFSFQAATFIILYLQARLVWKRLSNNTKSTSLIVPTLQFLVLTAAVYTALSRVMDYKHHAGDVVAGAILGVLVQTLNAIFVTKLFTVLPNNQNGQCDQAELPLNTSHLETGEYQRQQTTPNYNSIDVDNANL